MPQSPRAYGPKRPSALESCDLARLAGQLEDMQAGIGAVDRVDVAAIIDLDIIGLYGELAAVGSADVDAARLRLRGDRRDEIRDLARMVRIANVDCAHTGVEMRDKQDAAIVDRREAFVRRVRSEAPAARAKIAACLGHGKARHAKRPRFGSDVGDPEHLPRFLAFVDERLVDDCDEVARAAFLVASEFGDIHPEQRKRRVRADVGREHEPADLRIEQIGAGRLRWTFEQLLAIDDLDHSRFVGAIAEVDAIAGGSGRDGSVQFHRHVASGAGLLPREPEVADETRLGRITQVVDLRHPTRTPAVDAGYEVLDTGLTLPPVLVCAFKRAEARDEPRLRWIADVPDLLPGIAEGAQEIEPGRVAMRQFLTRTHTHHLRAAGLAHPFLAGDVREQARRVR